VVEAVGIYDIGISIIVIVAVSLFAPIVIDLFFAYRREQVKIIVEKPNSAPIGMQGLYRTLMAVGILLIILVLSIQMLVIFDANMEQIIQLLATIKLQNVLSPNEVVTGTDYGTAIQPKTSQPHIQSITTTNNDNATDNTPTRETTNNLLPTTDSLCFWMLLTLYFN
jgi:hypothetical protein